jgi:formylglycine-generating enzyme required for sulfatase activity
MQMLIFKAQKCSGNTSEVVKRIEKRDLMKLCSFVTMVLCACAPICPAQDKAIGLAEAIQDLPDSIKTPDRYALLIGVGQYQDRRIPKLPACSNDAQRLQELLIDPSVGMFKPENVTLLIDDKATRIAVVAALDKLARVADKEDLVVVFFSGHGAVDERGRSYWVMHNSKIDSLRATAFSETEISELLDEIRTIRLVTLIDACYSAATAEIGGAKSLVDLQKIYPDFQGEGRVAITASKGDQLSVVISDKNHPGFGHSAFTYHVIEGMKGTGDADTDGIVTVSELWGYVKDRTEATARQQGGEQKPQLKGQIGSKFLLTVDKDRLTSNTQANRASLKTLKNLFLQDKINADIYKEATKLLGADGSKLDFQQQKRKQVFADLAKGDLLPRYLQSALDSIETPDQRAARLEREARERAARQKRERISELLTTARANDNKANGHLALSALDELLELDSSNSEALALRLRISGYFGPSPGQVETNSIGMKLVWIPQGEFMMGSLSSESQRKAHEGPLHTVRISQGFWMGVYEVTQAQYQAVMGTNPSGFMGSSQPVEMVLWDNAVAFCRTLSQKEGKTYRLPTEAEWEYACRAGTRTPFSFGETINTGQVKYDGDYTYRSGSGGQNRGRTVPVGSFPPNAFGLYDMHGNVSEWCQDWYGEYYATNLGTDPKGPLAFTHRVLRGGSWFSGPSHCRSAYRFKGTPGLTDTSRGFRVVCVSDPG